MLLKFFKFGVVGFIGMLIDFGFTWLLKEKLKLNKYFANSTGFILAATSNYVLNKVWTFHDTSEQVVKQFSSFLVISLIGLGINNLVIYGLQKRINLNFYLAKLVAIGIVVLWNFFTNYFITFALIK